MAMAQTQAFDAEEPVIEAIRSGDRYAFSELMRRQSAWVRGVIFGVLGDRDSVEDVAQQVWMAVWQRIGELRETKRWRPWLYQLARNAAIDAGRNVTRRRDHMQRLKAGSTEWRRLSSQHRAATGAPDQDVALREQHGAVLAAVQGLPPLYREPFVMRHLNGWSYRQIAETMGMPVDSVETRLVRARRFLRASLENRMP